MSLITILLQEIPFLIFPSSWIGWLGLFAWLGLIAFLGWRWHQGQKTWGRTQSLLLMILLIFAPFAAFFLGIRLPVGNALPLPEMTLEPVGPALMLFGMLPWVLAAGLIGSIPAAILALIGGVILALWDTHLIYTPLEWMFIAVLFSSALSQRYRTPIYRALRHPSFSALVLSLFYPFLFTFDVLLLSSGTLVVRLDYALTHLWGSTLALAIPLILAGVIAEFAKIAFPHSWSGQPPWTPSPSERSLETRLFYNLVPLALGLIIVLIVGDWIVAGNAAREMLRARMEGIAQTATEGIPSFLDVGQSLIMQFATDPDLDLSDSGRLSEFLDHRVHTIPYFRQLFILDRAEEFIAGYPSEQFDQDIYLAPEEQAGIRLALNGVAVQVYPIPPFEDEISARLSFIAAIPGSEFVLMGRTDLGSNPYAKPILASLISMAAIGGEGYLLDETNRILYHPDINHLMLLYPVENTDQVDYYDDTAPDGTRQLIYFQPALGRPWSVVLTIPAQNAQQMALNIAAPLVIMIIVLAGIAFVLLRIGLRLVTASLHDLSIEADRISQGKLDHALAVDGDDEVAQLRRAFEQMRTRLKARLDELNRLLLVSQGVASSLEMEDAVQPILESALVTGACSARVVLVPAVVPETDVNRETTSRFGMGSETQEFNYLDEQILHLMRDQDRIVLTNPARTPLLSFSQGLARPGSLLAMALRHENLYYGTLWVAYDSPHSFIDEEIRFLTTLAGQAALAAANARLFMTAEVGRQRLAAILASTPDPVLVTDYRDYILLVNPAAWQVFGLGMETGVGKPVEEVIQQQNLQQLLRASAEEPGSAEITLPDGRIYLATASSILAEGQRIGRVCVLRDITYFKELDALKSEFVSTVSHDLRSPLTLMRGYATMLEMVGDLNEQQMGYVRKIVVGVESMSRLVNNLLDLGRIEADIGLNLEMVPVQDIIERVIEALSLQANQKRIQLQIEIPQQTTPLVEADQALLQQALHNLVENAIKYTPTNGKVLVSVRGQQNRMVFEVRDSGIGISPVDLPRLFEKFYRSASREAKKESGTGLGLAIVKSIAERHGGDVGVDSHLGKGSTFSLTIPLRQPKKGNVALPDSM
jgi:PAS domain S-box-containing protein